jgi:hypothetical protein
LKEGGYGIIEALSNNFLESAENPTKHFSQNGGCYCANSNGTPPKQTYSIAAKLT